MFRHTLSSHHTHVCMTYGLYKSIWVGNDFFLHQSVIFLRIQRKNLIAAGVLRLIIWFSVLVPKIKFDPPPLGKSTLVFIF